MLILARQPLQLIFRRLAEGLLRQERDKARPIRH